MNLAEHRSWPLVSCVLALFLAIAAVGKTAEAQTGKTAGSIPKYDHVFVIILENEGYNSIVGNQYAPR